MHVYGHHKIKETEQSYELIVYGVKPSVFNNQKRFTFDVHLDRSVLRINNIYRIYPEETIKKAVEEIISLMEIDRYILPYEVIINRKSIEFNFEECKYLNDFSRRKNELKYLSTLFVLIEDIEDVHINMYLDEEKYDGWMPKTLKFDDEAEYRFYISDDAIEHLKGEREMNDMERFQAFREEAAEKYGEEEVNASSEKMSGLSESELRQWKELEEKILNRLEEAVETGIEADSEEGKAIAELHRQWLSAVLPKYTPEIHRGIAQVYICDDRFTKYYDRNVSGCAQFLFEAVKNFI